MAGRTLELIPKELLELYEFHEWRNAVAVLSGAFPDEWTDIHEVDSFKAKVALELEWNNKTEFYDRDLNNFRLLFDLRVADVGVIITRCDELQHIFNSLGKGGSYGSTTTILSKLKRKLDGGAGGGCPVLAVGMKSTLYLDDLTDPGVSSRFVRIERVTKPRRKG